MYVEKFEFLWASKHILKNQLKVSLKKKKKPLDFLFSLHWIILEEIDFEYSWFFHIDLISSYFAILFY